MLVQKGINLYAVMEFMGHESIKTTERYAHHYPESLRPSIMVLDDISNSEQLQNALYAALKKASGEN